MLIPRDVKNSWGEGEFVKYPLASLQDMDIPEKSKWILSTIGLPQEAAPFLSFSCNINKQERIVTAAEMWGLSKAYSKYYVIGSTGSGDPICVEVGKQEKIVYLNHDNNFSSVFINSSIEKLLNCLLVYRNFIKKVVFERGEDAWLENNISSELRESVKYELKQIDGDAIFDNCFWSEILRG